MKIRYLVLAMIGVVALSLGAVACSSDDDDGDGSGGGELTLAEFFSELEEAALAWDDRAAELDSQAEADFDSADSDEEQVQVFTEFIDDGKTALDDFVDDLEGLNAPAEAEELLSNAVTAGNELSDMFDNVLTVLDTVETFADATALMDGPGIVAASDAFSGACTALDTLATENGITADLRCG